MSTPRKPARTRPAAAAASKPKPKPKRAASSAASKRKPVAQPNKAAQAKRKGKDSSEYLLRLYVAGQTPKSVAAFANLKSICDEHLPGRYKIEVIDLLVNPALARGDQILAVPSIVRQLPPPVKKIIGDFSDAERVLVGLDLRALAPGSKATSR